MFHPLLHRAARSTGLITIIEAEVASIFSVAFLSVLDNPMLLALIDGLLLVAGRRRGASRRRQRRLLRRSSAAARTGRLRRTARASPAALATPRGSPVRLAAARKKSGECRCVFLALCVRLCVFCARI